MNIAWKLNKVTIRFSFVFFRFFRQRKQEGLKTFSTRAVHTNSNDLSYRLDGFDADQFLLETAIEITQAIWVHPHLP